MPNLALGIGQAALGGTQGILNGTELVRRHNLEDQERGFAEENRGRVRQQWGREDALRQSMSLGTPDERIKAMRDAGLGQEADAYEQLQKQRGFEDWSQGHAKTLGHYQETSAANTHEKQQLHDFLLGVYGAASAGDNEGMNRLMSDPNNSALAEKYFPGVHQFAVGKPGQGLYGSRMIYMYGDHGQMAPMSLGEFGARFGLPELQQEDLKNNQTWLGKYQADSALRGHLAAVQASLAGKQNNFTDNPTVFRAALGAIRNGGGYDTPEQRSVYQSQLASLANTEADKLLEKPDDSSSTLRGYLTPDEQKNTANGPLKVNPQVLKRRMIGSALNQFGLLDNESATHLGLDGKDLQALAIPTDPNTKQPRFNAVGLNPASLNAAAAQRAGLIKGGTTATGLTPTQVMQQVGVNKGPTMRGRIPLGVAGILTGGQHAPATPDNPRPVGIVPTTSTTQ